MRNNLSTLRYRIIVVSFILFCNALTTIAQFEQKLTINLSGVFVIPDITSSDGLYTNGLGFDGGLQFNQNKHLSILANVRYYSCFPSDNYPDAYVDNLALGGGLKVNFAPRAVVNPYMFGEININFLWFDNYYIYEEPKTDPYGHEAFGEYDNEFAISIGGFGGGGLDFRISENIALYMQIGAYYTNYDTRIDVYTQAGLRINLLKSKTI